jgi:hypothetical protein
MSKHSPHLHQKPVLDFDETLKMLGSAAFGEMMGLNTQALILRMIYDPKAIRLHEIKESPHQTIERVTGRKVLNPMERLHKAAQEATQEDAERMGHFAAVARRTAKVTGKGKGPEQGAAARKPASHRVSGAAASAAPSVAKPWECGTASALPKLDDGFTVMELPPRSEFTVVMTWYCQETHTLRVKMMDANQRILEVFFPRVLKDKEEQAQWDMAFAKFLIATGIYYIEDTDDIKGGKLTVNNWLFKEQPQMKVVTLAAVAELLEMEGFTEE